LAVVEYLLSKGAQNSQKAYEQAMLHRHSDISKFLLNSGYVDINNNAFLLFIFE
jgi:hypothetical protein